MQIPCFNEVCNLILDQRAWATDVMKAQLDNLPEHQILDILCNK